MSPSTIMMRKQYKAVPILALLLLDFTQALLPLGGKIQIRSPLFRSPACLEAVSDRPSTSEHDGLLSSSNMHLSRRSLFHHSTIFTTTTCFGILSLSTRPQPAYAAAATATPQRQRQPLEDLLYRILRVREATQQETRLIRSGKFKDVQRANVKLAVKFMVDNYRLNDAFVAASAYLEGNAKRVEAGQVGTTAVQNLYTILEYFDSSDVQNLKVGTSDGMGGKEELVLKGLDATRKSIDDFLAYFPKDQVDAVVAKIKEENDLNAKEFDDTLGQILNPPPTKT